MPYSYQKLDDDDSGLDETGSVSQAAPFLENDKSSRDERSEESNHNWQSIAWYKRPSVFWLLPVFVLFNLSMGMTAMPRMNVLISLACRKLLTTGVMDTSMGQNDTSIAGHMLMARHLGGMAQHGSGSSSAAMNGSSMLPVVIGDHNPQCQFKEVESATAIFTLWGNLIAGILGAIVSPLWGMFSDRYGRVKVLGAASTVLFISEGINVLVASYPDTFDMNWIFVAFFAEGASGSFILIMALASSYATDCTLESKRNVALGWFYGSMFFGMAVGPALGGIVGTMGNHSRPLLIFYIALGMRLIGILFLIALVPESLGHRSEKSGGWRSDLRRFFGAGRKISWVERLKAANPLLLLRVLMPSSAEATNKQRRNIITLAVVNTIMFAGTMSAMNVMMLYSEYKFGWDNRQSGYFLSVVNIFRTLATVALLPFAIFIYRRCVGPRGSPDASDNYLDIFLIRLSVGSDIVGFLGYAISPNGFLFTLCGALASLGAIGLTTSEASLTKHVAPERTGELFGCLGLLQAMARILGPTVANLTYSLTVGWMPEFVFYGIAVCFVSAGVASIFFKPQVELPDREGGQANDHSGRHH